MYRGVRRTSWGFAALFLLILGLLAGLAAAGGTPVARAVSGVAINYKAGWNLVGGPDGTVFNGQGNAYTLGPNGYVTSAGSEPTTGGKGYWVFYAADTNVTLNGAGLATISVPAPAGQYVMIGNASGTQAANVTGADTVLSYDAGKGAYNASTTLGVGQGGWALSNAGGTITVTGFGSPLSIPIATASPSPTPSPVPAAGGDDATAGGGASSGPVLPFSVTVFIDPNRTTVTNTQPGIVVYRIDVYRNGKPVKGATVAACRANTVGQCIGVVFPTVLTDSSYIYISTSTMAPLQGSPLFFHVIASLDGAQATADVTWYALH